MNRFIEMFKNDPTFNNLIYTLVALVGCWLLLKLSQRVFKKVKDLNPDHNEFEGMIPFLENIAKFGLILLLAFELLKVWGIDVTPLLGAAGVAGVAIAFAAQDSVSNLFGGISIFLDKPFKIGDQVLIGGTERGKIYKIGARSTKIKTVDNVLVTIPNSVMANNPIYNETGYDPVMRVRINVGVSYNSNLEKIENIVRELMEKHEEVLNYPAPAVIFTEFGESAINLLAIATVSSPEVQFKVKHDLIKRIHKAFKEEGILIPYPQRDIHIVEKKAA